MRANGNGNGKHERDEAVDRAISAVTGETSNGASEGNGITREPFASDLAGVGGRKDYREGVLGLGRDRLALAMEDEEREERFLRALDYGLQRNDRTSMRIYAEARKLVGTQVSLSVQIVNAVGADAGYARGAVDALRRVESAGPLDVARAAFEALDALRGTMTLEEYRATLSGAEVVNDGE